MGKAQSDWSKEQTGRAASANDIAEVVDLLLTGECGWLNGVDIPVDGGYSAGLESGWGLLKHCNEEMGFLAEFLPELYRQETT